MNDIYFQGIWRMDWGLGNPNKTAALIAILMVAVWGFAYLRKWGFWVSLVLFSGLGICLVHTFSRGGVVAAFCGLTPLLLVLRRPFPWRRVVAVVVSIWVIVGASIYWQAHERFGQGVVREDRSITNRFEIWKSAPTMMVDAPGGWGIGKSGKAYMDWYQPLDRNEGYRTLVNSHLTWLVELGWIGRFLYLAGWGTVFLICFPSSQTKWLAVPFGIWLAFFTGAIFSSVAESPWLWIVPMLALAWVIGCRLRQNSWPKFLAFVGMPVLAVALCLAFFIMGHPSSSSVKYRDGRVIYGNSRPEYLVIADPITLGQNYPRVLRKIAGETTLPTVAMTESATKQLDGDDKKIVFASLDGSWRGRSLQSVFENAEEVIVVNPELFPEEVGLTSDKKDDHVKVLFGEFAQAEALPNWSQVASAETLPGIGKFIPDWPISIFEKQSKAKMKNE